MPFLFYFVNDQIEIIEHRDNPIPVMVSDKDKLISFEAGFWVYSDKNK